MVVGYGIVDLWINESRSLKEKRGTLKRILKRTQNTFNVSIAEIGDADHWKRAEIGFSVVGNEKSYINAKIDHILGFIDSLQLAEVVNTKIEIVGFSEVTDSRDYLSDKYD